MPWMIYGANGYTGLLLAAEAKRQGLTPILGGRNAAEVQALGSQLGLECRIFDIQQAQDAQAALAGIAVVAHCAGPFSATSAPMLDACLVSGTHYVDITGEISVFDAVRQRDQQARERGIVVCPGVGFDVIPSDCIAACLHQALPDATHLALGFDTGSGLSPGTAKTTVEGLKFGGKVRRDGVITDVPLGYKRRTINFGRGEKAAVTIPWGDVSTAFHSTGIPNIEVYLPGSPRLIKSAQRANHIRWLLGFKPVQALMKWQAGKVKGPSADERARQPTFVWGEVKNARGEMRTARLRTANGYSLTVTGSLAVAQFLLEHQVAGGTYTPSRLIGPELVLGLPESGTIEIS